MGARAIVSVSIAKLAKCKGAQNGDAEKASSKLHTHWSTSVYSSVTWVTGGVNRRDHRGRDVLAVSDFLASTKQLNARQAPNRRCLASTAPRPHKREKERKERAGGKDTELKKKKTTAESTKRPSDWSLARPRSKCRRRVDRIDGSRLTASG